VGSLGRRSAGSMVDGMVYSVKWIILSSSVMALSISTRRISLIGTDFLRYWLYELLLRTLEAVIVLYVIGVVYARALFL
jgi:hypothetical protein